VTAPSIVEVRGISKRYLLGSTGRRPRSLLRLVRAPYRQLRGLPPESPPKWRRDKTIWALRNVSFDVHPGEKIGVIGRNGAGKSTLLKILSRVIYPTEGEARIRGRVTSLLEVGTGFNDNLTGRENIFLNASLHGLRQPEIEASLPSIIEFSEIERFIDTPVKHYSSGMRARLAFSVAAHLDPDVLLLDEVLSVGDLSFQKKCLARVQDMTSGGRTLLFVSHSMGDIVRFCERCIWLDKGEVLEDGPAQEVVEHYSESVLRVSAERVWVRPSHPAEEATPEVAEVQGDGHLAGDAEGPSDQGGPWVRLLSARVVDEEGQTLRSVRVDRPLGIEVEWEVLRDGKNIQPALHFKTARQEMAFAVAYTDPAELARIRPRGRHRVVAWVPGNLLNPGLIYVNVAMATPDPLERHVVEEDAVAFHVYESHDSHGTARGLYARDFPGSVRPLLRWETVAGPSTTGSGRNPPGAGWRRIG
jgi:lipopolysaccharide transport system ATP-binding protein